MNHQCVLREDERKMREDKKKRRSVRQSRQRTVREKVSRKERGRRKGPTARRL